MTNEEAIDIIKCLAWHTRPNEEDIEQAIKALEQQPCGDCISRTEALKVIEEQKKGFYGVERYAIDECHSAVMKLPSVTPQQKWIPCSERVPEEDGLYFGEYSPFIFKREKTSPSNTLKWVQDIVAWMPLPERYKEGEEEIDD